MYGSWQICREQASKMIILQIAAFGITVMYVSYWLLRDGNAEDFIIRYVTISASGWLAEEFSIQAYSAYHYNPSWGFFIGHVPILIIMVWPLIIHSGWELASQLVHGNRKYLPMVIAGIVWIDASLIETISTKAGLWSWNGTGLFGVPLIGIFGWAYFAFFSILFIELTSKIRRLAGRMALIFISTVASTHILIITTWWLFFKWNYISLDSVLLTAMAWIVSIAMASYLLWKRLWVNFDKKILIVRMPPVLFFFILYLKGRPDGLHTTYLTAFAIPYILLLHKLSREESKKRKS